MKRHISIAGIGNSLMQGCFAYNPQNALINRFTTGVRQLHAGAVVQQLQRNTYMGGRLGSALRQWRETMVGFGPDVIVFQCVENEFPSSPPTALNGAISSSAHSITFDHAPVANQIYRLGKDDSRGGEWVLVRGVSSSTGTLCERGLFGSMPQNWETATPVQNDDTVGWAGTAWSDRLAKVVAELAEYAVNTGAILLVGGRWGFGSDASDEDAVIQAIVEGYDLPNVRFVSYKKPSGTYIDQDSRCLGPSGTTTQTLVDEANTVITLATGNPDDFDVNDICLLAKDYPALYNTSEVAKVTAKGTGTVTFARKQWSSSAITSTSPAVVRIGRMCLLATEPCVPTFGITGSAGAFGRSGWAIDTHPTDLGHIYMADAFLRQYKLAIKDVATTFF